MQEAYVKLEQVTKVYKMGEVEIRAVDGINFEVKKGAICRYCRAERRRKDYCFEYSWRHGHSEQRACVCRWKK